MGDTSQHRPGTPDRRPGRTPGPPKPGSAVLTPPTGLPAVGTHGPAVPDQRTSPEQISPAPAAPPAPPSVAVRTCTCGHPENIHEHYRAGDDCGSCGPRVCASFRDRDDVGPLRRAVRPLLG